MSKQESVKFVKNHIHAGKTYAQGAVLEVDSSVAKRLIDRKVAVKNKVKPATALTGGADSVAIDQSGPAVGK